MFQFAYDDSTGIVRISVLGSWTLTEIARYAAEATDQFAKGRRRTGSLRLLIDCSLGHVCPQALVEPLARAGMRHARADDRIAVVVSSSLMKLQIKRMLGDAPSTMFVSDAAARRWLVGEEGAGRDADAA